MSDQAEIVDKNSDGFDKVQVLHSGEHYFDVNKHSTSFVKRKEARYTKVEVKIPRNFSNFESIKKILYSHLYVEETASC